MGGLLSNVGVGVGCSVLSIVLQSRVRMVSMMKLLVPEFALLPLHVIFGNESDDDLMMSVDWSSALVDAVF